MKPKLARKLRDTGYPTHSKYYKEAHAEADIQEKRAYPKGYAKLKQAERKLGKHELMGKNTKSGKIEVERKYAKYKKEIALHERVEHAALKRLAKRHKKR